jgi:hypothetical protein
MSDLFPAEGILPALVTTIYNSLKSKCEANAGSVPPLGSITLLLTDECGAGKQPVLYSRVMEVQQSKFFSVPILIVANCGGPNCSAALSW